LIVIAEPGGQPADAITDLEYRHCMPGFLQIIRGGQPAAQRR
jgi:hypothetical protein